VLERRPVFKDGTFVAESLAHIMRTAEEERFEVLAYCFMPDRAYAQYIVTNPVRGGLVARADEYEFVGATEWTLEELMQPRPVQDFRYDQLMLTDTVTHTGTGRPSIFNGS